MSYGTCTYYTNSLYVQCTWNSCHGGQTSCDPWTMVTAGYMSGGSLALFYCHLVWPVFLVVWCFAWKCHGVSQNHEHYSSPCAHKAGWCARQSSYSWWELTGSKHMHMYVSTWVKCISVCYVCSYRGLEQFMKTFPDEVNSCKADDGHTALHIAAANNHLDMVCLLAAMVMPHTPHHASISPNHWSYSSSDLRLYNKYIE